MPPDTPDRKDRLAIARWLETQRGNPQYRPAPSAGRAVSRVMQPLAKKYGGGASELMKHWPDIVGARFAKISRPVKFTGSARGRQLVISAPGPAAALIMAASRQIIDRINGYLGPEHVKAIRVIQAPMQSRSASPQVSRAGLTPQQSEQLQSSLSKVREPDLKAALEKLGRHVYSENATKR